MDNEISVEEKAVSATAKISTFFKKNIFDIVIFVAVVVYIARGFITISNTGKSVMQILGDGIVAWLFAYVISRMLEMRGVSYGENSKVFIVALEQYQATAKNTLPYIECLDAWCAARNEKKYEQKQRDILMRAGITYERFIDENFDISSLDEEKQKIARKAMHAKIYVLTTSELMSESARCDDEHAAKSKADFLKRSAKIDAVSKIGLSMVFGYYGISLLVAFNWITLVWYAIQAALFVAFGVMKYFRGYMFVTEELKGNIIYKNNLLNEFINEQEKSNIDIKENMDEQLQTETV